MKKQNMTYSRFDKIEYSKDVWARGLNGGLCPVHLNGYCPVVEAAGVTSHVK